MMNDPIHEHPVRVVLLDELALFRASLGRYLASEPGLQVVGEGGTCSEALEILRSVTADVVLLDCDLGLQDGDDFISAARTAGYQGKFLIVVGVLDVRKLALALKRGATGVFLKSEALERLVQAIRLVAKGEVWVDQKVIQLLAEQCFFPYPRLEEKELLIPLGDRERSVLQGIVRGLTNRKIGDSLGLSESSVKNIVQRLFGITGVKTRGQLVRVALEGSLDRQELSQRPLRRISHASSSQPYQAHEFVGANLLAAKQSEE